MHASLFPPHILLYLLCKTTARENAVSVYFMYVTHSKFM